MRKQLTFLTTLLLSVAIPVMVWAQFETTLAGGPWNHPTTWKDNAIPGPDDYAIIRGPVTVDVQTQVGELKIVGNGSLQPEVLNSSTIYKLYVKRHFTNEGKVKGYNLWIYVGGNVYNIGSWYCGAIIIEDSLKHYFTSYPLDLFNPLVVRAPNATIRTSGPLVFDSTEVIVDTLFIGNNNPVTPNDTLYLRRSTILKVNTVVGNGNAIKFSGDSHIFGAASLNRIPVFQDVSLYGTVLTRTAIELWGRTVLYGVMRPLGISTSYNVIVRGDFINEGEVKRPGSGGLSFEFYGDLISKGPFAALNSFFKGQTSHILSMEGNQPFEFTGLYATKDTVVSGSTIRLDSSVVRIHWFDLRPGHTLFLGRGTSLDVDTLNGHGNTIILSGNAYLGKSVTYGTTPTYRNVNFQGDVKIRYSIYTIGRTRFSGIVEPYGTGAVTVFNQGGIENRGQILPNKTGTMLFFQVDGDIANYGTWQSYYVRLTGNGPYTLITDSTGTFSPAEFSNLDAIVHSGSDLYFDDCRVALRELVLTGQHHLFLRNQSQLSVKRLAANGNKVHFAGDSYINYLRNVPYFEFDSVNLYGTVLVNANLAFYGPSALYGTMMPYSTSSSTLMSYGRFQNHGEIKANSRNYRLYWEVFGDFDNLGTSDHERFVVKGTRDQQITVDDSASALSGVSFEIRVRGNSYQWEKDGTVMNNGGRVSGANSSVLRIDPLTVADAGTYQCRVDSAGTVRYSRKIQVNTQVTSVRSPEADPAAGAGLPDAFKLLPNYPNPFNPSTTIGFDLPVRSQVLLQVFDARGQLVRTLINGVQDAGRHRLTFSAPDLPSGVYFFRLQARPEAGATGTMFVKTQKTLLLK